MSASNNRPAFRVVSICKRGEKEYFTNVGAAWATAKGGFVIRLNAHPVGDTVLLRPIVEK